MKVMKKIATYSLLMTSLLWMSSCGNSNKSEGGSNDSTAAGSSEMALKPLTNETTSNQFHLYFDLRQSAQTDSSILYEAISEFNNEPVGFNVEIKKDIDAGIAENGQPDDDLGFSEGSVRITANGPNSDNFVKAMGTLFKMPVDGKMTTNTLTPMVFSSNKEKVDLGKPGTYSFKYFFENGTGKEAEMFGILDTYKQSFELGEKDSTYRAAIISAFEGK